METLTTKHFRFANFELDGTKRLLLKRGKSVTLNSKTLDLLLVLVEHRGEVLTKEDLLEMVWPDQFVEEGNLKVHVSALRKMFGEHKNDHRYIVTVPGRGYSFVAELDGSGEIVIETHKFERIIKNETFGDGTSKMLNGEAVVYPQRPSSPFPSNVRYIAVGFKLPALGIVALSAFVLAALGLGYWVFSKGPSNAVTIDSIAVMPFVNESGNSDVEYLSDGITESLINSLSQVSTFSVKPRSSVFHYKGVDISPQQIGSQLDVQAILSGRVLQRGDQFSLYLSLVDARTGNQIWGDQYNRKLTDLISLQGEIARDVSNKLKIKLSGADEQKLTKNYTENAEAYQLYLKGNYEWNKHTLEDLQKSVGYYNQALEKDPNYALAYTGLANSYGMLGNGYLPPNETFPKTRAYASKALTIDDTLAEAHTAMGGVSLLYDWNWAEAEKELKRAQSLNPNETGAHDLYGGYLEAMGRFDEAQAEAKRAQELDPLSPMMNTDVGTNSYFARQYTEAIAQFEKAINLEPRNVDAWTYLGQAYEQKKMYAQAIATFQKGITQAERSPQLVAALGHTYAQAGERDKALKTLDELREMSKQRYVSPYLFAVVYVGLGDKDQALAWLEKAYQDRSFFLVWLKVEPFFDPLRDDARFQDLLRRIGL